MGSTRNMETSSVTDMESMFSSATKFNSKVFTTVTEVTSFHSMFEDAINFNQVLPAWDVGKCSDFSNMFKNAISANGGDIFNGWENTPPSATYCQDVTSMFEGAVSYDPYSGPVDPNNWEEQRRKTNRFRKCDSMFKDATKFNGAIIAWSMARATSMNSMFKNAVNFNQDIPYIDHSNDPDFSDFWSTNQIRDFNSAFEGATKFNGDITNWMTRRSTTMASMFEGATNFNGDITAWKPNVVTKMANMFKNAKNFNRNIANNNSDHGLNSHGDKVWNVNNVVDMTSMFEGATEFNKDISNWGVTKAATDGTEAFNNMFYGASKFQQNLCLWIDKNLVANDVPDVNNMFGNSNCPTPNALVVGTSSNSGDSQVCCACDSGVNACNAL